MLGFQAYKKLLCDSEIGQMGLANKVKRASDYVSTDSLWVDTTYFEPSSLSDLSLLFNYS